MFCLSVYFEFYTSYPFLLMNWPSHEIFKVFDYFSSYQQGWSKGVVGMTTIEKSLTTKKLCQQNFGESMSTCKMFISTALLKYVIFILYFFMIVIAYVSKWENHQETWLDPQKIAMKGKKGLYFGPVWAMVPIWPP